MGVSAPPDRYAGIVQALTLARLLTTAPWQTRAELAAALGVHERTIRRIIEALRAAGLAVEQRERGTSEWPTPMEYRLSRTAWRVE